MKEHWGEFGHLQFFKRLLLFVSLLRDESRSRLFVFLSLFRSD